LTRARKMADALWARFADHSESGLFMGKAAEEIR
jgi:hypothetical protein